MRRRGLLLLPALAVLRRPALAGPARAALSVGPEGRYPTLAAAIAAARDGDTLLVQAGTYADDIAVVEARVTIRAVGGMARLVATVPPPNGKAILVIRAGARLEGLDFSGARSASLNGAGIRYEGGRLEILRCRFAGNEMNMLAGAAPGGSILVAESEFGPTVKTPSLSHGLYVNQVDDLTLRDSLFHGAITGHQIKSRAWRTTITGCRIHDGTGWGSYSVDLPNGGEALIAGNVIEQGPLSDNPAIIHFGGEGPPHPGSLLRIVDNTVVNRLSVRSARLLRNQTAVPALVTENRIFGLAPTRLADGPARVSSVTVLGAAPVLDLSPPWQGRGR